MVYTPEWYSEALSQWRWAHGAEHPEQAWLLSDLDTWEPNPHYRGPKQPHPEDCASCYFDSAEACKDCHDRLNSPRSEYRPLRVTECDDDLPF